MLVGIDIVVGLSGSPGGRFEASGGRVGASWGLFWASWGPLGVSWRSLGAERSSFRFVVPF
eukprot:5359637-Pyramimonas_sp.AAC.1